MISPFRANVQKQPEFLGLHRGILPPTVLFLHGKLFNCQNPSLGQESKEFKAFKS